jgi:hypothetical protein
MVRLAQTVGEQKQFDASKHNVLEQQCFSSSIAMVLYEVFIGNPVKYGYAPGDLCIPRIFPSQGLLRVIIA